MRKYVIALSAVLTPALLSVPAFASDGGFNDGRGDSIGGGRDTVSALTQALDDVADVMGYVWFIMTSNPMFLVFLGASLFSVGIWIFKKVKRAAKG